MTIALQLSSSAIWMSSLAMRLPNRLYERFWTGLSAGCTISAPPFYTEVTRG
jgi:hypothetical protein